ncbi:hypothetical protein GUITHDRAFT_119972 [Guillardia theta CCMP2712]|uniref:Uncharacterized protein n=1 Tax=Guillardia theta (strain CCMP2712) TaxID=905079 RepID=L1ICC1_GUITC|nr:hypothetical protein GUITHDRAFT_122248 [Guillardia theta CCMP2712]XP_005820843.1 hypothetical protein GUITHDRAFT_119972 [Guillardia theta CCMP2712]EKX31557.1 hypothetical protein GUITHDRAFT_122248 [Guillardia theta CCMP2712]EKX33863.1 hypothetical protein GUITHDRAFT_119972 [Guillardia theta CCMP2712]|eukprot:XP_005818537.1 hypothetical protein GUITHDRAFT_122248 [Guillardia theta CCMP2712]
MSPLPAPRSTIKIAHVSAWSVKRSPLAFPSTSPSPDDIATTARKAAATPALLLGSVMAARSKAAGSGAIEQGSKITLA